MVSQASFIICNLKWLKKIYFLSKFRLKYYQNDIEVPFLKEQFAVHMISIMHLTNFNVHY